VPPRQHRSCWASSSLHGLGQRRVQLVCPPGSIRIYPNENTPAITLHWQNKEKLKKPKKKKKKKKNHLPRGLVLAMTQSQRIPISVFITFFCFLLLLFLFFNLLLFFSSFLGSSFCAIHISHAISSSIFLYIFNIFLLNFLGPLALSTKTFHPNGAAGVLFRDKHAFAERNEYVSLVKGWIEEGKMVIVHGPPAGRASPPWPRA
jgi:hypothetical protein